MKICSGPAFALVLLASTPLVGVQGAAAQGNAFTVTKLDADQVGKAMVADANLINPWGLCQQPGGPVWAVDNRTNLSTVYNRANGQIESTVVNIPIGIPAGCAYNGSNGFQIDENGKSGAATFLFDTETGVIEGWNNTVNPRFAVIVLNNSYLGAVYKGIALDTGTNQLYAANFAQNKVEVYNSQFQLVNTFTDTRLKGYGPFNIVDVNGALYVSFAKQDRDKRHELDRLGFGYVDVFDTNGRLVQPLIAKGPLDAPWGMTIAPAGFGPFSGDLLVGNFGNGLINAFDPGTGAYIDTLRNRNGANLTIRDLWALDNGPGSNQVSFSAGPGSETHGLLGIIGPQ